jgi:hypothetical protein
MENSFNKFCDKQSFKNPDVIKNFTTYLFNNDKYITFSEVKDLLGYKQKRTVTRNFKKSKV